MRTTKGRYLARNSAGLKYPGEKSFVFVPEIHDGWWDHAPAASATYPEVRLHVALGESLNMLQHSNQEIGLP